MKRMVQYAEQQLKKWGELMIAPHETLEIHELLQLKNICALKTSGLTGSIADPKLRVIMETILKTPNSNRRAKRIYQAFC